MKESNDILMLIFGNIFILCTLWIAVVLFISHIILIHAYFFNASHKYSDKTLKVVFFNCIATIFIYILIKFLFSRKKEK